MEWIIFGSLVTLWGARLLEVAHSLGFLDKRSQRPPGLLPRRRRRRIDNSGLPRRRRRRLGNDWHREWEHLENVEINQLTNDQWLRVQMLQPHKKNNPVAERVNWKKEGF